MSSLCSLRKSLLADPERREADEEDHLRCRGDMYLSALLIRNGVGHSFPYGLHVRALLHRCRDGEGRHLLLAAREAR